ncbi:acyclic terpene utilization AtuA family protein [Natronorubrum sp. FCH18a]|uniref:acyclic terpene utilization AtuA family protein n=1 Tax=Natronorubrum sp. FCH18a TaxID=3447018 RepID=UPI003F519648
MVDQKTVRIGAGSAHERDKTSAAVTMVDQGNVEYLCCDRMAEVSLSRAMNRMREDPNKGYGPKLDEFFSKVLPIAWENDTTIIGSFGMANPTAAGKRVEEIAASQGCDGVKVATVTGDNVVDILEPNDFGTDGPMTGATGPMDRNKDLLAANAYLGVDSIIEALENDADVIIGGRFSDAALFAAPLIYEFNWMMDDWEKLADAYTIGHLLECGGHATGGNFAYPGYVEVPDLHHIGNPLAEVSEDGDAIITKPNGTGGVVTELSVASQLLYEVEDPENYYMPDVVLDISNVKLKQIGEDEVKVYGSRGKPRPNMLKVNGSSSAGYKAEVEVGWAGPDTYKKAKLHVEEMVKPRLTNGINNIRNKVNIEEFRIDIIGVDSIFGPAAPEPECDPNELRVRVAAKFNDREDAERFCGMMIPDALFGPVGAGGVRQDVQHITEVHSTLISREKVSTEVEFSTVELDDPTPAVDTEVA